MTLRLHDASNGLQDEIRIRIGAFEKRRKHRHELHVLTCYVDFDALESLIEAVAGEVRLTGVRLIFDFSEIYRRRTPVQAAADLARIARRSRRLNAPFAWCAVKAGELMHGKAFAIIQRKGGLLHDGLVWVTSGNATKRGLGQAAPNFELSLASGRHADLRGFLSICDDLEAHHRVDISRPVANAEVYGFAYELMASGAFLHKWTTSLSAQMALRYPLTELGRSKVAAADIEALGFEVGVGSLSRQPLALGVGRVLPKDFARNYTIDTLLGRWCPHCVWSVVSASVSEDAAFGNFRASFRKKTTEKALSAIVADEKVREGALVAQGYVEADDERFDRWRERTARLRDDDGRLQRIFLDHEEFALPYPYEEKAEVTALYQSLYESVTMANRDSLAVGLTKKAIAVADPRVLVLNDAERRKLHDLLGRTGPATASARR